MSGSSRILTIIGPVFAVLALASCGGGGAKTSAAGTTTTSSARGDRRAALQPFRDCMSQHGMTLPDRPAGTVAGGSPPVSRGGGRFFQAPPGVDAQAFDAARQACQDKLPAGGFGGGANNTAFQAYRRCLADHGVQVPDMSTTPPSGPRPTINRDDPKFAAADQTCRPLLPSGGPGDTTTTSRPS